MNHVCYGADSVKGIKTYYRLRSVWHTYCYGVVFPYSRFVKRSRRKLDFLYKLTECGYLSHKIKSVSLGKSLRRLFYCSEHCGLRIRMAYRRHVKLLLFHTLFPLLIFSEIKTS